jgi:hypothetical protein
MEMPPFKIIYSALITLSLFGYWIFNFIIIYHLSRFGIGVQPKKFAVVFFLGAVGLFFLSAIIFASLNFQSIWLDLKALTEQSLLIYTPLQ